MKTPSGRMSKELLWSIKSDKFSVTWVISIKVTGFQLSDYPLHICMQFFDNHIMNTLQLSHCKALLFRGWFAFLDLKFETLLRKGNWGKYGEI